MDSAIRLLAVLCSLVMGFVVQLDRAGIIVVLLKGFHCFDSLAGLCTLCFKGISLL